MDELIRLKTNNLYKSSIGPSRSSWPGGNYKRIVQEKKKSKKIKENKGKKYPSKFKRPRREVARLKRQTKVKEIRRTTEDIYNNFSQYFNTRIEEECWKILSLVESSMVCEEDKNTIKTYLNTFSVRGEEYKTVKYLEGIEKEKFLLRLKAEVLSMRNVNQNKAGTDLKLQLLDWMIEEESGISRSINIWFIGFLEGLPDQQFIEHLLNDVDELLVKFSNYKREFKEYNFLYKHRDLLIKEENRRKIGSLLSKEKEEEEDYGLENEEFLIESSHHSEEETYIEEDYSFFNSDEELIEGADF